MHTALENCDGMNEQATAQLAGEGVWQEDPVSDAFQEFVPISEHLCLSFHKICIREFLRNISGEHFPENHHYFSEISREKSAGNSLTRNPNQLRMSSTPV